jgi:hypothetical protein
MMARLSMFHRREVAAQRSTPNPHRATYVPCGFVGMEIENTRLFELVWIRPRPSPGAAPGFGRGAASGGPLSFELAFHLGHGAHDGEETAPRSGGGIDVFS